MSNKSSSWRDNIFSRINFIAGFLGALVIFGLMLYNTYATVSRRFFHSPVPGSTEISSALLPVIAFLGMAFALEARRHINIDLIIKRLGNKTQLVLRIISTVLILAFSVIALWKGTELCINKLHDFLEAPVRIPILPFYAVLPIGSLLLLTQAIRDIRIYILSMMGREPSKPEGFQPPHTLSSQDTLDI